ncbi:hypothetical protein JCM9279_007422 [Rhodotorula babjevae]
MAKGLFAVYRDDPPVASPSAALGRPLAPSANKSVSARRKDGAPARLDGCSTGGLRVPRLGEKENVDPLGQGVRRLGAGKLGKKPSALAAKKGESGAATAAAACGMRASAGAAQRVKGGASNAVCTGTLRTRVLPDLPPLEPGEPVAALAPAPRPAAVAPHVADIVLDSGNDSASPRTSLDARSALSASTGSSARDSGYVHSVDGRAGDTSLDMDIAAAFADEEEQEAARRVDEREADRRARALTESPLAEITQAFTGLGGFSAANMASPTPRPHAARPAPPTRTRSSPSKAASHSAIPTRMVPYAYSTSATTKRARPKQTPAAGGGPLRF